MQTANDCGDVVFELNTCADNSWELFDGASGYFCCTSDQYGVYIPGGGPGCIEKNVPVPASSTLTPVSAGSVPKTIKKTFY